MMRYVRMMNARRHADEYARETEQDQLIMERAVLQDWTHSLHSLWAIDVKDIRQNDKTFPDFVASCRAQRITIELTELVNDEILRRVEKARKGKRRLPTRQELFAEAQWDEATFVRRVERLLDAKHEKYSRRKPPDVADVLIVHTAEPWLRPSQVEAWLPQTTFQPRSSFRCVHLLMSYDPLHAKHRALFELYGTL